LVSSQKQFFLDWMKLKFPKVCVIFIPRNCIGVFQPIDVILQCPFKHAFKKKIHSWTCLTIISQLKKGKNPKVDFWMLIMKPNLVHGCFMHGFMWKTWMKWFVKVGKNRIAKELEHVISTWSYGSQCYYTSTFSYF